MLYIRPTGNGYEAYNVYHRKLFTEENCSLLFSFIEADSSALKENLHSYFDSCIDTQALSLSKKAPSKSLCEGIKKGMEQIHPYLAVYRYAAVFAILAEHLNRCIREQHPKQIPSLEEYTGLLRRLCGPLAEVSTEALPPAIVPTSAEFAGKFYRQLESLYTKQPQKCYGFDYIEAVRQDAERYIYWVLDQSSFRFSDLDRSARVRLYSQIFRSNSIGSDLRFISHFYWQEPEEYDYYSHTVAGKVLQDFMEGISVAESGDRAARKWQEEHRRRQMASFLAEWHSDSQELSDELKSFMDDEIHTAKNDLTPTLFEEFRVDNLYQLIWLQLWLLTKSDITIKRCRHCGRLFIADRLSVEYCQRIAKGETEPCDIVGPKKSFSRLMDEDQLLKTYNRVYKTRYARVKRGAMSEEDFSKWKTEARQMLDRCRAGELPVEEYDTWMRSDIRTWGTMNPGESKPAPKKIGE